MGFVEDAAKAQAAIDKRSPKQAAALNRAIKPETFAFNPASGVAHTWQCGLGPERSRGRHRNLYVQVPLSVLPFLGWASICTRCMPDTAAQMYADQNGAAS